jgi:IS5 family transposase
VGNKHKLIREYAVSDSAVRDSQVFDELIDPTNAGAEAWGNSTYRSV